MTNTPAKKRKLVGVVVSDAMQKTVVVRVDRLREHPKYEQRYLVSRNFKAHDEKKEFRVGDRVVIEETRPLSRDKCWRVVEKIGETKNAAASARAEAEAVAEKGAEESVQEEKK